MASFGTEESWSEWRDERDESFKDPYGWFSLVELTWLGTTPQELDSMETIGASKLRVASRMSI